METKKKLGIGFLVLPIAIYFLISTVTDLAATMVITQRLTSEFMAESEELQEVLGGDGSLGDTFSQLEEIVTPEVSMEIAEDAVQLLQEYAVVLTMISAAVGIPIFAYWMKRDRKNYPSKIEKKRETLWKYSFIAVISVCGCIALNNLLTLTQLAQISESYQEVAEAFYSPSLTIQILGLGILAPIVEELLFRGVIYTRLKMFTVQINAALLSALLFGIFHGNLVQTIYGFVCGLFLAWVYDKYNSIAAPIFAHICLNLTSVLLTNHDVFVWIFEDPLRMGIITVVSAMLTSILFVVIKNYTCGNFDIQYTSINEAE